MKRTLLLTLAAAGGALALAGCNTEETGGPGPSGPSYTPPSGASEAFRDSDFAWSTGSGGGSVDGILAYKSGSYTCSGGTVVLVPETPWSRARMRVLYNSTTASAMSVDDVKARTPPQSNGDYQKYARSTQCDAQNHFSFANLPNGGWYAITVATPSSGTGEKVAVMKHVTTSGGNVKVTLR